MRQVPAWPPKDDLYLCRFCGRPIASSAIVLITFKDKENKRKHREPRRRLECGHHISLDRNPIFRRAYSHPPKPAPPTQRGRYFHMERSKQ